MTTDRTSRKQTTRSRGMWCGALLGLIAACERPTAPVEHAPTRMNVPTLSVLDAIDVADVLTDDHLRADALAACARGPLLRDPPAARNPETRIVATRNRDGSLVRFRGMLDAIGVSAGWFEMVRDWPDGRGIRIGQVQPGSEEIWVLRYGPGARGRVTDERFVERADVVAAFARLRTPYARLECPRTLHRKVSYGGLLQLWETPRDSLAWRESWPPRPRGIRR